MIEKNCKFSLSLIDDNGKELSKEILTTKWTEDISNELMEKFYIHIKKEIALVADTEIRNSITEDLVYNLLNNGGVL